MLNRTFTYRIDLAKNILTGLRANAERMAGRGIDAEFLAGMDRKYRRLLQLAEKRNSLKAEAMETTAAMEQLMNSLEHDCVEARKMIRIEMPVESWPEFGFRYGEFARKKKKKANNEAPKANHF